VRVRVYVCCVCAVARVRGCVCIVVNISDSVSERQTVARIIIHKHTHYCCYNNNYWLREIKTATLELLLTTHIPGLTLDAG